MSQGQVGQLLGLSTDTMTGWGLNRHSPFVKMATKIIEFIGINPLESHNDPCEPRLCHSRLKARWTQAQCAEYLKYDESNLRLIELGIRNLVSRIRFNTLRFIEQ